MWKRYFRVVTVHKSLLHINGWKKHCARRAHIFTDIHTIFNHMQIWKMRYKGAPLYLPKMMKLKVVELKARIQSQIQNHEKLSQLITNLQASHARVFRSMDVIMHMHVIPSISTLTEVKTKNQVQLDLDMYFDQLMLIVMSADLQMSADTMHEYVFISAALNTMMHMLSDKLDRGAKSVYPDAMEARVHFQQDVTFEHADTIMDYQAWHQFATIDHREDVEELVFP